MAISAARAAWTELKFSSAGADLRGGGFDAAAAFSEKIRLPRGVEPGGEYELLPNPCRSHRSDVLLELADGRAVARMGKSEAASASRRARASRTRAEAEAMSGLFRERVGDDAGERGIVEAAPPAGQIPRRRGDGKSRGVFPVGGQRQPAPCGETGNRTPQPLKPRAAE